jgi:hypothetical protein
MPVKFSLERPTVLDDPLPKSKQDAIVQKGRVVSSKIVVTASRDWWWLLLRTSVASAIPSLSAGLLLVSLPWGSTSVPLLALSIVWAALIFVAYRKRQRAILIMAQHEERLARLEDVLERAPATMATSSQ